MVQVTPHHYHVTSQLHTLKMEVVLYSETFAPDYIQASVPPDKCQDSTSNQAVTYSFYNLFSSLIMLLSHVRAADSIVK
jgi:hypothetical protein